MPSLIDMVAICYAANWLIKAHAGGARQHNPAATPLLPVPAVGFATKGCSASVAPG